MSPHDVFTPFLRRFTDERARSLKDTRRLYYGVAAAHRASRWARKNAIEEINDAIADAVSDVVEVPQFPPLAQAIDTCQQELLALETTIFSTPNVDFSRPISLREQVDLNRFLRTREHFLAHQDRAAELILEGIGSATVAVVNALPSLEPSAFAVPLITVLRNPRRLLDEVIGSFFRSEHSDLGLFTTLTEQLHHNLCRASGMPADGTSKKPLIWPSDSDLSPSDLVHAYLRSTPLQALMLTPYPLALPAEQRFSGHWVIAPPGRGKTTLLHSMLIDDLRRDASIVVIDSKGDLLEPISRLRDIADRLVLIEPDPDRPLALNPLDIPKTNVNHAVSLLEYIFSSLLDAKMTSLQQTLFRSVLPALIVAVPNPTLETFREIMANGIGAYRTHFEQLPPDERHFFFDKSNGFESKTYQETRNQLIWRLQFLMSNPIMKAMFNAPKTRLDIGREMNAGKVLLINNSKSVLGEEGAEFFGRFFIALILAAAEQRSGRSAREKLPCHVYIDECQTVIRRDTKIATILDECRSQKIGLVLAHQRAEQIKDADVLSALANCAIRFANSDDEAKYLAEKLRVAPDFLRSLGRGRFAAFVRDVTPSAVAVDVSPIDFSDYEQLTHTEIEAIRARMQEQYGAPVASSSRSAPPPSSPHTSSGAAMPAFAPSPSPPAPSSQPAPPDGDPGEPASEW